MNLYPLWLRKLRRGKPMATRSTSSPPVYPTVRANERVQEFIAGLNETEYRLMVSLLTKKENLQPSTTTKPSTSPTTPAKSAPYATQVGGSHYKKYAIQPVEFIRRNKIPYVEGCAIKYLVRHTDKNGKQDLEKAKHYIDMLIHDGYGEEK